MSRKEQVAIWTLVTVLAAGASWISYGFGFALARAHQQPTIAIHIATPMTVRCEPAGACTVMQGAPP